MWRRHNVCWRWPPFAFRQDWTRRAIFWKVLACTYRSDFGHYTRPIWLCLIISYGDILKGEFTKTSHEPQTPWKQSSPKKFRQWQQMYWQGLSKIWRAGFNLVGTQMLATSSTCYDAVTFLTQWGKSASNVVAIASLKKCWLRYRVGHPVPKLSLMRRVKWETWRVLPF